MAIQRLTAAYRSRSRPSSTLGAKASTMCPYYLDGDLRKTVQVFPRVRTLRFSPGDTRYIGYCAVFKVREEGSDAVTATQGPKPSERRRHAGLSKLNSMWNRPEGDSIGRNQDFSRAPIETGARTQCVSGEAGLSQLDCP
jgi:hypothetical protein